ncbi:MAG: ABC transporter permease [Clostridia bacterium]|nr:ABC transporter permease [Clostridia bacterium]
MRNKQEAGIQSERLVHIRHRGRGPQVIIYLGKLLRMFLYQNDWKVLPMAAIIAALVSMVIKKDFFLTMEGELKGAFALACVAIWNGCFNSIQVICRERNILKREHRAGLHISSYIAAHMIYQALLCLVQSGITIYVLIIMGVKIPLSDGLITFSTALDLTITVFLVSFASDMLSLLISAIAHSTTTAMTIMPFVLIFQLVFSGGIFNLPAWSEEISHYTISSYGLKCFAAQSDYNNSPMVTLWNTLVKMKGSEIGGTYTVGQVLNLLEDKDNHMMDELRSREINATFTVGELWDVLTSSQTVIGLLEKPIDASMTVGEILASLRTDANFASFRELNLGFATVGELLNSLDEELEGSDLKDLEIGRDFTLRDVLDLLKVEDGVNTYRDTTLGRSFTLGELIDAIITNPDIQARRDQPFTLKITVGQLIDLVGEDNLREYIQTKTAQISHVDAYEKNVENVVNYWLVFILFAMIYALLSVIVLEFIDKDRR